jgi:hypothetical protein
MTVAPTRGINTRTGATIIGGTAAGRTATETMGTGAGTETTATSAGAMTIVETRTRPGRTAADREMVREAGTDVDADMDMAAGMEMATAEVARTASSPGLEDRSGLPSALGLRPEGGFSFVGLDELFVGPSNGRKRFRQSCRVP